LIRGTPRGEDQENAGEEVDVARVIVIGGGVVGLSTAMLLGKDGHEVTVLERDDAPMPSDPDAAWAGWGRRGVNQFRMLHFFLPRFRQIVDRELPDVARELAAAGALRMNNVGTIPDSVTGGLRPDDDQFELITARRPVGEMAIARAAERAANVDVRRGVAVEALLVADADGAVPNVVGVRTEGGDELRADVVVDAAGRRSSLPALLGGVGARAPEEELDDCGFIYWGRHFRSADGSTPPVMAPLLSHYGTVSILTLPADNGTWGVGFVTSARDKVLHGLKDDDTWARTIKLFPLVAHWAEAEPIDDKVAIMAKIEDRHRSFVVDGAPVATGVLAVGDSWACTNPSVGRGMSIGLMHAVALRDLLRDGPLDDPRQFALDWHAATMATVEPWYRSTLSFDRHRLAEIEAGIDGREYVFDDPTWEMTHALEFGGGNDPEVLRAFMKVAGVLELPEDVLAAPGVFERVVEAGGAWRDAPIMGPDRETLLKTVAA
jgi:2-polyprenyl-6-methoxyphenol hydroxylase-like FAD-dependent oxidoreductase